MNFPPGPEKINFRLFLLPVLPFIFFFFHNIGQFMELILTSRVLILFVLYCLLAYVCFGLIKLFIKSTSLSLLISTLINVVFLSYGQIQDVLFNITPLRLLSNSLVLLIICTTFVLAVFFLVRKRQTRLFAINRFLVLLFSVLIVYEAGRIGYKIISGKSISGIVKHTKSHALDNIRTIDNKLPDIYHIIFDSYTNYPVMKDYWGYDNDIYSYLNSKGFYTMDSATSNYKSTPFSISSILNLEYLKGVDQFLISTSSNFFLGQRIYKDNALYKFLKKNNYQFSIFTQLEKKDMMLGLGFLGVQDQTYWLRTQTLERLYLNPWSLNKLKGNSNTQPASVIKSMENFTQYNDEAIDHILNDCNKTPQTNSPIFSFTHIMLPHDPYVHDENGNIIKSVGPGGVNMQGYLSQLKYSNKLIRQIIDCLLRDTSRNKIIILQGDHGYRHFSNAPLAKQYGALNAFYFYNKDYSGLYKNMSNVNTYRVVINKFFNGNLPLLEDKIVLMKKE